MADSFDVVVVGARCAGAPLAMLLARSGLRVCLIDRSRFPSEVPSTHAIQPNGTAALARWGLDTAVRASGAPPIVQAKVVIDDVAVDYTKGSGFTHLTGGTPMYCVRRSTLDPILIDAAVAAGADFRPSTPATGVITDDGRVSGVETPAGEITAALVVGADGPHSGVARLVGSREYHSTPPGRMFMWGYFGLTGGADPRILLGKKEDTALLAAPCDGDLFLVAVVPSIQDKSRYLADTGRGLREGLSGFAEVESVVGDAELVGPVRTMTRWHGYFREATGPGWVLAGDAGHFKDPTPGQGIADAFRQVERLAPAVIDGLADGKLDGRLEEWARWRDRDAWEMYWFATNMGASGPTRPLMREMIRQTVSRPGGQEKFLQVLNHDLEPSRVFTPARAMGAALSLFGSGAAPRSAVWQELRGVVGQEITKRRLRRNPRFESAAPGGETDEEPLAAASAP